MHGQLEVIQADGVLLLCTPEIHESILELGSERLAVNLSS